MQPSNDAKSLAAVKLLRETGECKFDVSKNGAQLKPVAFGSRSGGSNERYFHSFVLRIDLMLVGYVMPR